MTSVSPKLDPAKILERGFVTVAETESVDLADFSCKVNLFDQNNESEGIWVAILTEEDAQKVDANTSGLPFWGVLLNHALCFFPNRTWGRVIEGKTAGEKRPVAYANEQVERFKATHEAYTQEFSALIAEEEAKTQTQPEEPKDG